MKLLAAGLLIAFTISTCSAHAQVSRAGKWPDTMDLTFGFTTVHANAGPGKCGCYFMYGSDAQFEFNRRSGLGVLFDYSSVSTTNINNSGHNVSLSTWLPGFRYDVPLPYALRWGRNLDPYAHGLVGVSHTTTNFILDNQSTNLAYAGGGGVDFRLTRRFEARLIQADYLITHVPNGANDRQNQLRLTAGLVFHLNRPGF
jgi:outer membrane immunogenic protein